MKIYRIVLIVLIQLAAFSYSGYSQLYTGQEVSTPPIAPFYSNLYFWTSGTNPAVNERSYILSDKSNSRMMFGINNNGSRMALIGTTSLSALVPGNNGALGINTSNPLAVLHILSNGTIDNANLAKFTTSTNDYLRIGTGNQNLANFEINAFAASGTKNLVLQGDNNAGNTGIGSFIGGTAYYGSVNSKLHLQGGNVQIINSGASPLLTDNTKYGLTMGYSGSIAKGATDYSWFQSSNGPIVLNPRSANTLTSTGNSTNYVAIGYIPDGTAVAPGYNLLVQGRVLCEELKVKLKTAANWPDYVFSPDYKLMSVDSLQSFINTNCHLPEIPSAKEVEENGIMTGEMNGLLLKKVEELTLYMLEQNKTNTVQEEQIELLKKQNELLMKQIEVLISKSK